MPFLEHLEELRWRIIWSVLAVVVGSAVGIFAVIEFRVIELLTAPLDRVLAEIAVERPDLTAALGDGQLGFLSLTEPFFFAIQVGVVLGFLVALPVVAYQVWAFFAPALEEREKRVIVPSLYLGLALFAGGVAMAYFLVLPATIRFLVLFGTEWFTLDLTAENYLSMVWRILIAFGLMFELPVVVMILSALGLVTPAFLRSKRRHAVVGLAVLASVATPGDFLVITVAMLLPLIALYELGIVLSALVRREPPETLKLVVPLLALLEARARLARGVDGRRAPARSG
jgi:sec-independent protein translocase protein TatC